MLPNSVKQLCQSKITDLEYESEVGTIRGAIESSMRDALLYSDLVIGEGQASIIRSISGYTIQIHIKGPDIKT